MGSVRGSALRGGMVPGWRTVSLLLLSGALLAWTPSSVQAQGVSQAFQRVNGSVVVVRARGRELVTQSGSSVLAKFNEVGSGVLVSTDGKVLTAAHVVQIADEITVEFVGGETVPARVLASEPRADLALLQLERVPRASSRRSSATRAWSRWASRSSSWALPTESRTRSPSDT